MAGALEESEKTISILVIIGVIGVLIWALIRNSDFDLKKSVTKLTGTRGSWGKGIDQDQPAQPPNWWAGVVGDDNAQGFWESLITIGNDLFGTSDDEYSSEQKDSMTALSESWTPPSESDVQNAVETASTQANAAISDPESAAFDFAKSIRLF